jgi:DNA-binding NarL/FixJ family response regulator
MYLPIRIVIADDHQIFRDGLKLLVRNQPDIELIGEAGDGEELLEVAGRLMPDVVITDIKMPKLDGIRACKLIRQRYSYMKVIALSMFNEDSLIVDMLEAGATGYLLKNTNRDEFAMAVKSVHEGGSYYSHATSQKLAQLIADSKFNPYRHKPVPKFSLKEKEIIRLICAQLTSKEIAAKLELSIRTVESHREKIQEKVGARNSVGIVIYAIKHDMVEV